MKDRPDSMLLLRQADVRALVIVGELDRVTPIAEAMSLRSLLKGELVVVPNVGHLPNVEDPLAFNAALAAFLGVEAATDAPDEVLPEAEPEAVPDAPRPDRPHAPGQRPERVLHVTCGPRPGVSPGPPRWVPSVARVWIQR